MQARRVAGAILAGGRSRRMKGAAKAHLGLAGKPLIRRVIDRVRPQVGDLSLSVERISEEFEPYGLVQNADSKPGSCGPLGGLLSALTRMDEGCEWLLLVPCDAPFLPLDLALKLRRCTLRRGGKGCVVRYQDELQPTFSLWNRSLQPAVEFAVGEQEMGGFKQFLKLNPLDILDWEESEISPFFNINDPGTLARAEQIIELGMAG